MYIKGIFGYIESIISKVFCFNGGFYYNFIGFNEYFFCCFGFVF